MANIIYFVPQKNLKQMKDLIRLAGLKYKRLKPI